MSHACLLAIFAGALWLFLLRRVRGAGGVGDAGERVGTKFVMRFICVA